jgi:TfoX/Sxy family transcriptional regulator of competence genes
MSPMSGGMPKPDADVKAAFQELVPQHPGVGIRPMFGNLAGFANGNMFTGLFGPDLFVRCTDTERTQLLVEGGADFAPMAGRPMKGYVTLPAGWAERPEETRARMERALEYTLTMPAKVPKPRGSSRKAQGQP